MDFFKVVFLSGPEILVIVKGDHGQPGHISCGCFPDSSGDRGYRSASESNWFLGLLFFLWSLGWNIGVFVISERVYLVFGGVVSKHEGVTNG